MQFGIQREVLLKPLQQVIGVVERRQTLPVLSNLLVSAHDDRVTFTGTDLEVEMQANVEASGAQPGEITVPARKLFDICRALPDGSKVQFKLAGDRATVSSGRSRFTLATLPASEFPVIDNIELIEKVSLPEASLKELMDRTAFAMANQDVRYYLNGLLLDLREQSLRCVATDGHRLAMAEAELSGGGSAQRQIIIPRKGVLELQGLFESGDGKVELEFGKNHLRVRRNEVVFTSKLIDGRFPDYEAVIPIGADKEMHIEREVAARRVAARGDPVERKISRREARSQPEQAAHRRAQPGTGRGGRGTRSQDRRERTERRFQRQLPARCAECAAGRGSRALPARRQFELPAQDAGQRTFAARHHAAAPLT